MKLVDIKPSTRKGKKLMATFRKDDDKEITTHFGSANMRDFTLLNDKNSAYYIKNSGAREVVRQAYLRRHAKRENWFAPMTAGALSRWILWEKPTLKRSIANFKRKFKL
tara:strand:+ start:848 stop:1174 length:327 start_codon:yes stop_codon:yes gene_type:complete